VAGNEYYVVQRNGVRIGVGLGANDTSYVDSGAKACGTYLYGVASVRSGCTDKWVGCGSISQVINAPIDLTATRAGCSVNLKWTDKSNIETSFVIRRALDSGAFVDWHTLGANVTTDTDSNVFCGASPAASAKYRVYARNTSLSCGSAYVEAGAFCPLDATTTNFNLSTTTLDIVMGEKGQFSYQIRPDCGVFDWIEFINNNPTLLDSVDFTPGKGYNKNSSDATVDVWAGTTDSGPATITVRVHLKPTSTVDKTINVNVKIPDPWWQTKDGDVHANGTIASWIPAIATVDKYLSLAGDGGMPGVVSYGNDLTLGVYASISEKEWQAKTAYNGDEINYDYLVNRLNVNTSSDTFTGAMPGDSGTYYSSSGKTLSGGFPAGKKIVIFVNGDVTVGENVVVPENNGFFALIAKGNLTFAGNVQNAQGFFLSNGTLSVAASGNLFTGQGGFIGWGGVSMNRDLGASTKNKTPSEFFLFRPDLLINAPKEFLFTPFVFQEVAP